MTREEAIRYLERHGFIDDEVKDMCIEALATSTNVGSKWIPCSERLPKPYEQVLVFTDNRTQEVWTLVEDDDEVFWEDDYGYGQLIRKAIAWQPLPEPYKGE